MAAAVMQENHVTQVEGRSVMEAMERLRLALANRLAVRINADIFVDYWDRPMRSEPTIHVLLRDLKRSGMSLAFETPVVYETGGAAELMQSIEYRALDLAKKLGWAK